MIITFALGGILLILCEIFLPGGIIGTLGGIMLAVAVVAGFMKDTTLGVFMLIGSLLFGMVALWAWVNLFPKTPMGKRVFLSADGKGWQGFDSSKTDLIGMRGVARTPLHPGGIALIDGKRVDVVTRGELIDPETAIEVIAVEGNRVVVSAFSAE